MSRIVCIARISSDKLNEVIDLDDIRLMALPNFNLIILLCQLHRHHLPEVFLTTAAGIHFPQISLQFLGVLAIPIGNTECLVAVRPSHLVADSITIPLLEAPVIGLRDLCSKVIRPVLIFIYDFRIRNIEVSLTYIAAVDQVNGTDCRTDVVRQVELWIVDEADGRHTMHPATYQES